MAYEEIGWIDKSFGVTGTPLNAENFNHMDKGIHDNSIEIEDLKQEIENIDVSSQVTTGISTHNQDGAAHADIRTKLNSSVKDVQASLTPNTIKVIKNDDTETDVEIFIQGGGSDVEVVNTTTETVLGKALDAIQNNPAIPDTLANKLNNLLGSPNFTGTPKIQGKNIATTDKIDILPMNLWVNETFTTSKLSRVGDTVTINATIKNGTLAAYTQLFSIPATYRPANLLFLPVTIQNGATVSTKMARLQANGVFDIAAQLVTGDIVMISASYII